MMNDKKELLAYCGLYCGDCAGFTGEIANAAQNFKETIEKCKFHQTAKHLFPTELKDYDKLRKMIDFMTELKCPMICRQRKDSEVKCKILKCCRDKGFFACYECDTFDICDKLKTLSGLHGDSHIKNLRAIYEKGLDNWILRSKRLWFTEDD